MNKFFTIILTICTFSIAFSQNKVHFIITDESAIPLVGANVVITGTTIGTTADIEGKAELNNLSDGKVFIRISYIGYEEKRITLNFPADNNKTIRIKLKEGEELEEIVISTTRSSRTIEDIPTRIEAITGEELGEKEAMNSSNIGMLLRETTGIQMQQTSLASGNMSIKIQGLDGRYTQLLKDGFPLYSGFAGGLSIMQIPPIDLKQVELIKGSNSTLYGGGAIAGLVNLVSIVPENKPRLTIMLNQTSAKGSTGNIFYAQKYGSTGVTLYGSAYSQVAYDPDDDGFSNIPETNSISFNPKFFYYVNPNIELNLGLNTTFDKRTGGDMQIIKDHADEEHVFSEQNTSERYSTQFLFLNKSDHHTLRAKNSISYFSRELKIQEYRFSGNQISSFTEILYTFQKNEKTDWQFGINHYYEKFAEKKTDTMSVRDYNHNTWGGFVQYTSELGPMFTLESGFRADYDLTHGIFLLPRTSLLLKTNKNLVLRLGGGMGYKLPTIFTEDAERLYFKNISPLMMDNTSPETSMGGNFDINYKTVLFDKFTFAINQFFYVTRLKNALVLNENELTNIHVFENADGPILTSGFETNIKLTYDNQKLYLNYALINTKLKYDNINKQKPLTPKNNAGLVLMYDEEEKWSIGYELYYTGWQFDEQYQKKTDYWEMGFMVMKHFKKTSVFINFENFSNTLQTNYEPLVLPPVNTPSFPDIWAPTDGFIFNGGIKINIR
ncbi:MAG: TonB-dependent receptor [Bacteroidetes bacterium HGW-Bacteroidetes-17]|nr:MAG: TonB-dependent receptor [Bacteroidetes bacterium HGW-Bacteroidetes-17]